MKRRPEHARGFRGRAKVIPERDVFLLPYQARWVEDGSLIKLMEKSRRVGISYATAYGRVREHATTEATVDSWVSSRDEGTAKLFIEDCKRFARILQAAAKDLGREVLEEGRAASFNLEFAGGTAIHSLTSNPNAFAGKGGNVVLDEFALRDDPRMVYAIAKPTIDWGGHMELISTHRGSNNFFAEMVREIKEKGNPKGISLHTVSLQDALDEGFLWKLQSKLREGDERLEMDEAAYWDYVRGSCADEESFQQEYCCVPADDATAFLDYHWIVRAEYSRTEDWEVPLELCRDLYVGFDVARQRDFSVIWVAERFGDVFFTRKVIRMERMPFREQEERLYEILELPNVRRCLIDSNGLGMQLAERAHERFGWKAEGVTFTNQSKQEMGFPVRAAFEDGKWRIPPDDRVLRADLRSVKKDATATGLTRITAERSAGGHADHFWALALCQHAIETSVGASEPVPMSDAWRREHRGRTTARRARRVA